MKVWSVLSGQGWAPAAGACEYNNQPSVSKKRGEFLDQLSENIK